MVAEKEGVAKIIELVHEEEQNKESTKINLFLGNSLAVQWVGLGASTTGGPPKNKQTKLIYFLNADQILYSEPLGKK